MPSSHRVIITDFGAQIPAAVRREKERKGEGAGAHKPACPAPGPHSLEIETPPVREHVCRIFSSPSWPCRLIDRSAALVPLADNA